MGWLRRTTAGRAGELQIMYGVGGERLLPEVELDWLEGYRGSKPVRIGNGAYSTSSSSTCSASCSTPSGSTGSTAAGSTTSSGSSSAASPAR